MMSANIPIPNERYLVQAFQLGLQYLAAGRYSAAAHLVPVSANPLHHSIEMFLKGCLVKFVGFDGLPRGRRNGHDLKGLWHLFRAHVPEPELDRFNAVIYELHNFEHIRYPEN